MGEVLRACLSLVGRDDRITALLVQPEARATDSREIVSATPNELLLNLFEGAQQSLNWDKMIRTGDARSVICQTAQNYDFVVIGSQGQNEGVLNQTLGSTADYVLRNCPAKVILVPIRR